MTKKTALVTGGMGGIGTEICRHLHDAGYVVATTYHSNGERQNKWLAAEKPRDFHAYACDIADWESCVALKEKIGTDIGRVDILVNNAGITRDATFLKMTPEMWREVLTTNLDSVFYVTKQFLPDMLTNKFGRIINISSVNGQKGQFGQTNYSAAKSGMYGFTKSLAQETIKKGVTVNTISPGYIRTKMVEAMSEEIQDKIRSVIPLGRFGEVGEIARIVAFLAADESAFITGANINANGGQYML